MIAARPDHKSWFLQLRKAASELRPATSATDRQRKNADISAFLDVLLMLRLKTLFFYYSFLLYAIYFLPATLATKDKKSRMKVLKIS
ncbi:UNVERIFIED_CONTAM: hypothetical protein NY603_02220 [Bacteroidetes bacterium 56_B9]